MSIDFQGQAIHNRDAASCLHLAETAFEQDQISEAIAACQQAIVLAPDHAPAYAMLGQLLRWQGKFPAAIRAYQKAIDLQPNQAIFYHNLADICYQINQLKEAIAFYQKSLTLNEAQPELCWKLAQIFQEIQQETESQCYENQAYALNPNLATAQNCFEQANTLATTSQLPEAIELYQQAIWRKPNYASAYLNLGITLRRQGKLNRAMGCYQQAIALNPCFAQAYFSLGNLCQQQGHLDQAIAAYLETLQIQPDFEPAYLNLWHVFLQKNCLDESLSCALHHLPPSVIQAFISPSNFPQILSKNQLYSQTSLKFIHPPTSIHLTPPKTLGNTHHFRFDWQTYTYPETFFTIFSQGRAWADAHTTAVLTAQNQLLTEVSQGSSLLVAASQKLPKPVEIEGNVAFLSVRGGLTYYHWMADLLGKIALLRISGFDFNKIDKFVVNRCSLPFQQQTLSLLGFEPHQLIESSQYPHIKAQTFIVPSLPGQVGVITPWVCEFLRQEFLPQAHGVSTTYPTRIFMSRQTASYRRIVNEEELMACLSLLGFGQISLDQLSFLEQVKLMAGAEVVIAPHGAGLTNTVFCRPETKIIEIFCPEAVSVNYWILSNLRGLDYYYLLGDRLENYYALTQQPMPQTTHPIYRDIFVNLASLLNLLEFAGIS